jgi:hypothetical protein
MTLNLESFDDKSKKKNKTKYKAALGVGSAVSLFGIGSSLAANISLNGPGNSVEFGQGVVTTAACDEDGFSITPVTYFDNQDEIFKVDYVQVSGVNLTPEGTGYELATNPTYADQAAAKAARPGKYYDSTTSTWKNTCDGVVLDFKAYTDDVLYLNRTIINNVGTGNLQNPIGWYQDPDNGDPNQFPGFAIVINISDGGSYSLNESNYAVASATDSFYTDYMDLRDVISSAADSSFRFNVDYNRYSGDTSTSYKTNAASISKITVQSMDKFPSSYYAWREGLGEPVNWNYSQP